MVLVDGVSLDAAVRGCPVAAATPSCPGLEDPSPLTRYRWEFHCLATWACLRGGGHLALLSEPSEGEVGRDESPRVCLIESQM